MADRYILGPRAARFIHEQMNASAAGSTMSGGVVLSQSLRYPDPWTVQFAASVRRAGETEEDSVGHWIAYLPDGSWHGATVESDDDESEDYLEPADTYGDGWYIFPEDLEDEIDAATEAGDPIEIYARLSVRDKILLSSGDEGVRIAVLRCSSTEGTKNVDQIVRSTVFIAWRPWSFVSTTVNGTRFGGWRDCQLQVGFNCNVRGSYNDISPRQITGCNQTEDGRYFAKVNLNSETAVIERLDTPSNFRTDYVNGFVWVYVGKVENGVQTDGIYSVPVIYKFI